MEVHERVLAIFRPKRTDDLQHGSEEHIGKTYIFQAVWILEEGPYKGEWAMMPIDYIPGQYFGWVPECDLKIVKPRREG